MYLAVRIRIEAQSLLVRDEVVGVIATYRNERKCAMSVERKSFVQDYFATTIARPIRHYAHYAPTLRNSIKGPICPDNSKGEYVRDVFSPSRRVVSLEIRHLFSSKHFKKEIPRYVDHKVISCHLMQHLTPINSHPTWISLF